MGNPSSGVAQIGRGLVACWNGIGAAIQQSIRGIEQPFNCFYTFFIIQRSLYLSSTSLRPTWMPATTPKQPYGTISFYFIKNLLSCRKNQKSNFNQYLIIHSVQFNIQLHSSSSRYPLLWRWASVCEAHICQLNLNQPVIVRSINGSWRFRFAWSWCWGR